MIGLGVRFSQTATWVFDPVDAFAAGLGFTGLRPRPIGRVEFEVVARLVAGVEEPLAEPVFLRTVQNPSGYYLFFDLRRLNPADPGPVPGGDRVTFEPGQYVVRVSSPLYQTARLTVPVPMVLDNNPHPEPIKLQPGPSYPFSNMPVARTLFRGSLLTPDGLGIAGRTVSLEVPKGAPAQTYTTDETGRWVFVIPEPTAKVRGPASALPTEVTVSVALPDTDPPYAADRVLKYGESNTLPLARIAGRVRTRNGVPIRDARIAVSGEGGESHSNPDGRWTFAFPVGRPTAADRRAITATLPDGRSNTLVAEVKPETETPGPDFEF